LARFAACCLIHFQISDEVCGANKLMKYVSINHDRFERPMHALAAVTLQFFASIIIEGVNIWNLVTNSTIIDIMFNFLAL